MNYVSTYTILDKDFFQSFSNGGRFAWLPIDNNMVIVFNLRSDTIVSLRKKIIRISFSFLSRATLSPICQFQMKRF